MMPGTLAFQTAALAALVLREPWTRRRAAALAVVASGIVLLASSTMRNNPGAWRGDLLFLCAAFNWATFTILLRSWRVPALDATIAVAFWPAVFFLPVWVFALPTNLHAVPWGAIAFQFVWQGAVAVIVAGFLFARAVVALGPGPTTTITSVVPALAALGAWPLLEEPLGALGLVGVALVCAGMVMGVAGLPRGAAARAEAARP
ncbi:EamA family transporter [Roseomonas sp. CCTCC AB2023176]|uniref:EamA family transporter n=1 Tax=Roseomonas sp. CCTCC AB2023176 TaxID=3342640 RepID=UPI0035D55A18